MDRLRNIWRDYAWLPPVVIGGLAGLAVLVALLTLREPRPTVVLEADESSRAGQILVLVEGAVRQPGYYLLPSGSTLDDAISRAGGVTVSEAADVLDGSEPLSDGQRVLVPEREPSSGARINVNSASEAELEALPGIGPVIAQRIVEYRSEHGPLQAVHELAEVNGISDRMIDDIRHLITLNQ